MEFGKRWSTKVVSTMKSWISFPKVQFSFQGAARTIGFLDIIFSILSMVLLGMFGPSYIMEAADKSNQKFQEVISIFIMCVLVVILITAKGILLAHGAQTKDLPSCQFWFHISLMVFFLWFVVFMQILSIAQLPNELQTLFGLINASCVIINLLIVQAYINELQGERKANGEPV